MKKPGPMILIIASLVFAGFLIGFFIGRNCAGTPILVSGVTHESSTNNTGSQAAANINDGAETNADGKININTATAEQLQMLPGIGEVLAKRIVDDREENGPFKSITDLSRVEGIGSERLVAILEMITVGG